MRQVRLALVSSFCIFAAAASLHPQSLNTNFARDPQQPIDQEYTDHIHKYTTDPSFTSPLVDYLPASKTVPTPAKVLGDVSGAPDMLPYAEDVYKYFRMLGAASPRVKVFTIGHTEEGREMIAVAIADAELLKNAEENKQRLAQLARSAHHQLRRRKGPRADRPVLPGLLHHRHHTLSRNRRADGADGTGLSPCSR